jgi:hypothetical protein
VSYELIGIRCNEQRMFKGIDRREEESGEISLKKIGSLSNLMMITLKQRRPDPDWSDKGCNLVLTR